MRARAVVLGLAAATLGLTACGKDEDAPPGPGASQLTVYSSLPLQGPLAAQSRGIIDAEKLALTQAGGRVGPFTVKYVALDDSRGDTGRWDPGTVMANARRAVEDRSTIAYLGEADSGASAVAIPVLNEAGILTVSPASTYAGLTTTVDADKGEPEKYYPSGTRTFARVVPADSHQARVQVDLQRRQGCRSLFVLADRDVYGRGIATAVGREAQKIGLAIAGQASLRRDEHDFAGIADDLRDSRADCVFTGLTLDDDAVGLYAALHAAAPRARFFAPDGLAVAAFAGRLPATIARTTWLTSLALDDAPGLPGEAARFRRDFRARYGRAPEPYAIYGYAAMRAVLRAIADAGNRGGSRPEVVRSFFALRDQPSVLGRFSVTPQGDTTVGRYAVQRIAGGRLRTERVVPVDGA